MKKLLLILSVALLCMTTGYAQKAKFGHVDYGAVMKEMPGIDTAQTNLLKLQKELQESSENAVQSFPKLTLTDQQWNPAERDNYYQWGNTYWFAATEDGIYHSFSQNLYPSDGNSDDAYVDAARDYEQKYLHNYGNSNPIFFTLTVRTLPLYSVPSMKE